MSFLLLTAADRFHVPDWLAMAEQAVNAIYALSEHPDQICGEILQVLFGKLLNYISQPSCLNGNSPISMSFGPPIAESSQKGKDKMGDNIAPSSSTWC